MLVMTLDQTTAVQQECHIVPCHNEDGLSAHLYPSPVGAHLAVLWEMDAFDIFEAALISAEQGVTLLKVEHEGRDFSQNAPVCSWSPDARHFCIWELYVCWLFNAQGDLMKLIS